jgi:hypothetical protein
LRAKAAELARQAYLLSDEAGGAELDAQAKALYKQAREIEERLPAEGQDE